MKKERKNADDCHKATLLIEKSTLTGLSRREKLQLAFHLNGCPLCRTYREQSLLIDHLAIRYDSLAHPPKMKDDTKRQLKQMIATRLG